MRPGGYYSLFFAIVFLLGVLGYALSFQGQLIGAADGVVTKDARYREAKRAYKNLSERGIVDSRGFSFSRSEFYESVFRIFFQTGLIDVPHGCTQNYFDLPEDHSGFVPVCAFLRQRWISDRDREQFFPDQPISRREAIHVLAIPTFFPFISALRLPSLERASFLDVSAEENDLLLEVAVLQKLDVLKGLGKRLGPEEEVGWIEAMILLDRFLAQVETSGIQKLFRYNRDAMRAPIPVDAAHSLNGVACSVYSGASLFPPLDYHDVEQHRYVNFQSHEYNFIEVAEQGSCGEQQLARMVAEFCEQTGQPFYNLFQSVQRRGGRLSPSTPPYPWHNLNDNICFEDNLRSIPCKLRCPRRGSAVPSKLKLYPARGLYVYRLGDSHAYPKFEYLALRAKECRTSDLGCLYNYDVEIDWVDVGNRFLQPRAHPRLSPWDSSQIVGVPIPASLRPRDVRSYLLEKGTVDDGRFSEIGLDNCIATLDSKIGFLNDVDYIRSQAAPSAILGAGGYGTILDWNGHNQTIRCVENDRGDIAKIGGLEFDGDAVTLQVLTWKMRDVVENRDGDISDAGAWHQSLSQR